MKSRLILFLLLVAFAGSLHGENLFIIFTDPAGDSLGSVDVVGVGLSFDKTTGAYTLLLLADSSAPFHGDFRVNINLYNPDTGTTNCDPSFFNDTMNDYIGFPSDTILVLSGVNSNLRTWDVGDRVATNSTPFGNPDCTSLFHSAVADLCDVSQRDLIADGDTFATIFAPVIFVDGFESGDTSTWSESVGLTGLISTISLQVTPGSVPPSGGMLSLLALVKDQVGQGVANAPVNFLTEAGTLGSGGALLYTDSDGQATDTLTVTQGDLDALAMSTFVVRAQTVDSAGHTIEASFLVHIQIGAPIADFTFVATGLQVQFLNQSTGDQPLSFLWDFGDGVNSTEVNPTHSYSTAGTYTVTLTATNAVGTDSIPKLVTVSN